MDHFYVGLDEYEQKCFRAFDMEPLQWFKFSYCKKLSMGLRYYKNLYTPYRFCFQGIGNSESSISRFAHQILRQQTQILEMPLAMIELMNLRIAKRKDSFEHEICGQSIFNISAILSKGRTLETLQIIFYFLHKKGLDPCCSTASALIVHRFVLYIFVGIKL